MKTKGTLEEVAKKQRTYEGYKAFIEGSKWQQEQDKNKFSEEEMLEIIVKCPYVLPSDVKNWFQKFKKK